MDENNRLDLNDLENVTGGTGEPHTGPRYQVDGGSGESYPAPRYKVGDKVLLKDYPKYGVGTVKNVYLKNSMWTCQVYFDAGVMDASQDEFLPA